MYINTLKFGDFTYYLSFASSTKARASLGASRCIPAEKWDLVLMGYVNFGLADQGAACLITNP